MLLLHTKISLRGRRLKGKGKGVLGARKGERGGREGNACEETVVFSFLTSTGRMLKS